MRAGPRGGGRCARVQLEGGAADGALEPNYLERLMDYTVHFGDSVAPSSSSEEDEDRTSPRSTGRPRRRSWRAMGSPRLPRPPRASLSGRRGAREYTRQCELLGGVEAAFSEVVRGNPVETEANRAAALAAARSPTRSWCGRTTCPHPRTDAWCPSTRGRVVGGAGCAGTFTRGCPARSGTGCAATREDARLLQSLGREVVKSAGKAADLAKPAIARASVEEARGGHQGRAHLPEVLLPLQPSCSSSSAFG